MLQLVSSIIAMLASWPVWALWLMQLLCCFLFIFIMLRCFGPAGLYVFMGVTIVVANIQINKIVQLPFFVHPVPLGTALISCAYLASDILAEYYGVAYAKKGILLSFAAYIVFILFIMLTLGFRPLPDYPTTLSHRGVSNAYLMQRALYTLFNPALRFLLASVIAYLISQYSEVTLFVLVKRLTYNRWLWLRNTVSSLLAAFIDSCIFSYLAWVVFSDYPVHSDVLWSRYIFGTYGLRLIVSLLDTPCIYLAKYLVPPLKKIQRIPSKCCAY